MQKKRKMWDKMAVLSPHISIITLNINGLNSPMKRHRMAGWIKEQYATSRKHISALKTNPGSEGGDGRRYSKPMANKRKQVLADLYQTK